MRTPQRGLTRADKKLIRQHHKQARQTQAPCGICGQPINYQARRPTDNDAPSVDHIKPWRDFPELRRDPGNLRVVHNSCNRSKGVKAAALPAHGNASRDWSKPHT